MHIKYFEYIVKISELGSITKAAEDLYISQSYLSRVLKMVEEEFGVKIFTRNPNGVILTRDGEEIINYSRYMLNGFNMMENVRKKDNTNDLSLNITSARSSLMMESFMQLMKKYKNKGKIRVKMKETDSNRAVDDVYYLRSDIGLIFVNLDEKEEVLEDLDRKMLVYEDIVKFHFCLILDVDHPLLKKDSFELDDIYDYGLVKFENESMPQFHTSKNKNFGAHYEDYIEVDRFDQVVEVCDRASLHNLITEAGFVTIGSIAANNQEELFNVKSIDLYNLEGEKNMSEIGVVYQKNIELNNLAKDYIKILKETYSK